MHTSLTRLHKQSWLLGTGVVLRVVFFFFSQGNGGDAFSRAAITQQWLQHPSLSLDFGGPNWPPLHFWLMASVAQFVPDVLLACRLLSLVAGLLSLWLFWRLALLLFGESAAILSLTVFVFYSLHIAYATTSSSEEVYLTLVLGGLLGAFSFYGSRSNWHLLASGFSLTAAAAIRFEAWVVIFGLGVLFLLKRETVQFPNTKYWTSLLVFGASSGAWPIFWAIRSRIRTGHFFDALSNNISWVPGQLAVAPQHRLLYEAVLNPGVILLTLTPVVVAGTLYGLWLSFRRGKCIDFSILVIFFGLFQLAIVFAHGSLAMARYTLTLGTLFAVLAGYGLAELGSVLRLRFDSIFATLIAVSVANLALIIGLSLRTGHLGDKFRSISPLMQFTAHLEGVGKFLRPITTANDRFVIDDYNEESNLVSVVIGLPLLPGDRAFIPSSTAGLDPFPYVSSYHPKFAILSAKGMIGSRMAQPSTCSGTWIVNGVGFRCVYENEVYRIYEINTSESTSVRERLPTLYARQMRFGSQ
jgi:4-amino-4-deoxy-L-arabinose transferase-like glycosyltransferase